MQDQQDEVEQEYPSVPPRQRRGLRTGYTTGACATAAALAAARALLAGVWDESVTIQLPAGRAASFSPHRRALEAGEAFASVVKDAGDDPDVTHGAEICARVRWSDRPGVVLRGGPGVGTVTRPGLGLEVGGPAINPVPRRMLQEHLTTLLERDQLQRGLEVTIEVPRGEELARRTLNGRLGIVGGISILGTSGIVVPYSTAAWRASVEQAIDVAVANGQRHLVLSTGGRSERFAQALRPELPEVAFVEMGEFTGHCLKRCLKLGIERVTLAGMVGKFSKIAQGHFMTHVAGNRVAPAFLADLAAEQGAELAVVAEIRQANTARHFQEIVLRAGRREALQRLAELVSQRSAELVGGELAIESVLFDFDGTVLGRATLAAGSAGESTGRAPRTVEGGR